MISIWHYLSAIGGYLGAACSGPRHHITGRQATSKWFYLNRFPATFPKMRHQEIQSNKVLLCYKDHRELGITSFRAAYLNLRAFETRYMLPTTGRQGFWFRSVLAFTSTLLRRKEKPNVEVTSCDLCSGPLLSFIAQLHFSQTQWRDTCIRVKRVRIKMQIYGPHPSCLHENPICKWQNHAPSAWRDSLFKLGESSSEQTSQPA